MADPSEPATNVVVAEDSSQSAPPTDEGTQTPTTSTAVAEEPATPAAQEPPSDGTPPEPPVAPPASPEADPAPVERQPRPAERRINELVQQNKQLREQLSTVPAPAPSPQAPKLSDLVAGKEQLMPDELDELGQKVWQEGAQAARGLTSLEVAQLRRELEMKDAISETDKTAAQLPNEYDELNPKSPSYNSLLEKKIVDSFQTRAVRNDQSGNPTLDMSVKLADVAKAEVEFYREAMESGRTQTSNTLASQADEAAITPTSASPQPDKAFEQMSLAEQEAHLKAKGHDI